MTAADFFFQSLLWYLATHGDELSQETWEACHKFMHRYEMSKCREDWADYED